MTDLHQILGFQAKLINLSEYKNEFETMQLIHTLPKEEREICRQLSLEWLNSLNFSTSNFNDMMQKSNMLREQGNDVFTAKGTKRNVLAACCLYTKAIFAAPPSSKTLALAHANRAMALQEFGYFRQAYDDCECTLELGTYPKNLQHKILMRQAYCMWKLGDATMLQQHLDSLALLKLNESCLPKIQELHDGLAELKNTDLEGNERIQDNILIENNWMSLQRDTQQIIVLPEKGRHMIAKQTIEKDSVIFAERAPSFVPVTDRKICQQCAVTQFIPFPCLSCHGQVVYCSRKCRTIQASTHAYECPAYQRQLFPHIGISHLAMRTMLDGLPQVVPKLRNKINAKELWIELEGSIAKSNSIEYAETLRMITHLGSMSKADIVWFALMAELLRIYLKEFTGFFDLMQNTAASCCDWELLTASLILRHIGQLVVNGHTSTSIIPLSRSSSTLESFEYSLFCDDLWFQPYRVKRGFLHTFSDYEEVAAINFPYLSICNHACAPSFQPKFSGRYMCAYTSKTIEAGDEIFNCYTLDYRNSRWKHRRAELSKTYKFTCDCVMCQSSLPDANYEKSHRYRCENVKCRKIFVPNLPNLRTLAWWNSECDDHINCTICGAEQQCVWLTKFHNLLKCAQNSGKRCLLYKSFDALDNWLLDQHQLKLDLGWLLIEDCYAAHNAGFFLEDAEFTKIVHILKICLAGVAEQHSVKSVEYVAKMTYLWDIIALKKYNCTKAEMQNMINAIDIVSDEIKVIFVNYYDNYIKALLT